MDLSIIIVNWNTMNMLDVCLRSILNCIATLSFEIIVIDNNSTDGSQEMIRRNYPNVRLIESPINLGFAKGNNIGIKMAKGEYIALINSDILVNEQNSFYKLIEYMKSKPNIGIIGPRIIYPSGDPQFSCKNFPSLRSFIMDTFFLSKFSNICKLFSGEYSTCSFSNVRKVEVLAAAFWIVRRSVFEKIGSLDENYFIYSEDLDFCKRVNDIHMDIVFYPLVTVVHHHAGSSSKDPIRFFIAQKHSRLYYWKKHHGKISYCAFYFLLSSVSFLKSFFLIIAMSLSIHKNKNLKIKYKMHLVLFKMLLGKLEFPSATNQPH